MTKIVHFIMIYAEMNLLIKTGLYVRAIVNSLIMIRKQRCQNVNVVLMR